MKIIGSPLKNGLLDFPWNSNTHPLTKTTLDMYNLEKPHIEDIMYCVETRIIMSLVVKMEIDAFLIITNWLNTYNIQLCTDTIAQIITMT